MVSTVRPNARATPTKPMPRPGKPAARTAAPHPPKTSHAVPKNSANKLLLRFIFPPEDTESECDCRTRQSEEDQPGPEGGRLSASVAHGFEFQDHHFLFLL